MNPTTIPFERGPAVITVVIVSYLVVMGLCIGGAFVFDRIGAWRERKRQEKIKRGW